MPAPVILAATRWRTNGHLIAACHKLGYIADGDRVLDPTYGSGTWWSVYHPEGLVAHNRDEDGSDFRSLPYEDGSFDVAAYDPPYVAAGGRKTTTIPEFHRAYGMDDAPKTPALLQVLINDGLTEMARLTRRVPGGSRRRRIILVKCQDYVTSGRLFDGTYQVQKHAESLGLRLVDRAEHTSKGSRAQPERTRKDGKPSVQQHFRRNLSTLLVFTHRGR